MFSDYYKNMKTLTYSVLHLLMASFKKRNLLQMPKTYYIVRLITLSVITLSGANCILFDLPVSVDGSVQIVLRTVGRSQALHRSDLETSERENKNKIQNLVWKEKQNKIESFIIIVIVVSLWPIDHLTCF